MKALGLVVSEKKIFLCFSHCKSMGANDPRGGAIFEYNAARCNVMMTSNVIKMAELIDVICRIVCAVWMIGQKLTFQLE